MIDSGYQLIQLHRRIHAWASKHTIWKPSIGPSLSREHTYEFERGKASGKGIGGFGEQLSMPTPSAWWYIRHESR